MKTWRVFLGGLAFLLAGLGQAIAAGAVTLATYNIENYTLTDRMVEGVHRQGYPKPENQKTALRAVIGELKADILALQEIGGESFLRELQRDLQREGIDYPFAVALEAEDPARNVAVLSRLKPVEVRRHTDLEFTYFGRTEKVRRGLLEVTFGQDGTAFTVFVVHLKSRYTERKDDPQAALQRAGEATAIRDRIVQRFPQPQEARFLIAGDFNDARPNRPVQAMLGRGKTAIAELLPAADTRGHMWTHAYKREESYSRIDFILVSPGLLPSVRTGRAWIYDHPLTAEASDHRPVVVTMATGAAGN